jgi:hypothetical protein
MKQNYMSLDYEPASEPLIAKHQPLPSEEGTTERSGENLPESPDQNLALTVVYVP